VEHAGQLIGKQELMQAVMARFLRHR
jgi:hypothetical protein